MKENPTPKEQVKAVHPKAYCQNVVSTVRVTYPFVIGYYTQDGRPIFLGEGKTATLAWRNAAQRLEEN